MTIRPFLFDGGRRNYGSAFLPASYQGTAIGNAGLKVADFRKEPIENLSNKGLSAEQQRYELDMLQKINRQHALRREYQPELEGRIQAFELAFRMQAEAPDVLNVDSESPATQNFTDSIVRKAGTSAGNVFWREGSLNAGVRFIQCTHSTGASMWDQHTELVRLHTKNAREVDIPIAGLLKDLKSRGMLKDTLVFWGGEFGRTPVDQAGDGRDHNPYGYSMWMAGGGVKAGITYGATDEFGYYAVEDRMHIHDLHATILHLLGIDHEKLTYFHAGRSFRLTDVAGVVAHKIIA